MARVHENGLSHPLILKSPVNCNRRLAFQLIDARYAESRGMRMHKCDR